jgi:hypothetical protein
MDELRKRLEYFEKQLEILEQYFTNEKLAEKSESFKSEIKMELNDLKKDIEFLKEVLTNN